METALEQHFTIPEVVQGWKLSRRKVTRLVSSGELRSVKIGRARRIPASALEEFLRSAESAR